MSVSTKPTLVFDLDDTLVDTFGLLITPLEQHAAEIIASLEGVSRSKDSLLEFLLQLRRKSPRQLHDELAKVAPDKAEVVIRAHRQVFEDFSIDALQIASDVTAMLVSLSGRSRLVLLTEGDLTLQRRKIDHLGIGPLFEQVLIVDPSNGDSKRSAIKQLLQSSDRTTSNVVVIGNRLDNELEAAHELGAKTVWVRQGEGSEMPQPQHRVADAVVLSVLDLPSVLEEWKVL